MTIVINFLLQWVPPDCHILRFVVQFSKSTAKNTVNAENTTKYFEKLNVKIRG